jgi:hypothetical protein
MRFAPFALAAVLTLATAPVLADPPPQGAGMGAMRGMFSPEERMMMFADSMKATAGMSDDQKHAYREKRRAELMAMSDGDRAKLKADLDARWAALSDAQKSDLKAQIEAWRAAHHHDGGSGGQ